jgi:hypothetical protein
VQTGNQGYTLGHAEIDQARSRSKRSNRSAIRLASIL